jgi:hypothetical protein
MNRRSRTLVVGLAVALVGTLVGAGSVIAATKRHKAGVAEKAADTQTIVWRTGKRNRVYTKSTKWQVLDMPSGGCSIGSNLCVSSSSPSPLIFARGPISLTFSGMFSRAPVEIRFRDVDHLMKPGAVSFRPEPGGDAFSFTFVSPRKGERLCEGPQLEWRSPTGQETRLNKATIVVHYKKFEPDPQVGCA